MPHDEDDSCSEGDSVESGARDSTRPRDADADSRGTDPTVTPGENGSTLESTHAFKLAIREHDEFRTNALQLEPPRREGSIGRLEHYEVMERVGRGAMGVVLRAFDEQLHRYVAIKAMTPDLLSSQDARQRFIREARAAAVINHPNVVTIHAVDDNVDAPYLVMEFVSGQTLLDRIRESAPLPVEEILRISVQIAEGLSAAHSHGVIHRDIKPANIMLEEGIDRVKIADFGLARVVMEQSDLTSFGDMVGTPAYMSPEQVDGRELDGRSDLFSFGCVMYAMVKGDSPFRSSNALATARKVTDERHPSLLEADPDVPEFLTQIIDRLLKKNPGDRYQTAEQLLSELRRHLAVFHQEEMNTAPSGISSTRRSASPSAAFRVTGIIVSAIGLLLSAGVVLTVLYPAQQGSDADPPGEIRHPPDHDVFADQVLTVDAEGQGEFTSLAMAISNVRPGITIHVLDDATHEGPFDFSDEDRFLGVTIESESGALLTVPENARYVIGIDSVSDFTIRGFQIETVGAQHGIEVGGVCSRVRIQDCALRTRTPDDATVGLVYVHARAAEPDVDSVSLRNLTIDCGQVGIVLGSDNTEIQTSGVVVEDCDVHGVGRDQGFLLVLLSQVSDSVVSRNTFAEGLGGVSVSVPATNTAESVEISRNTFYRTQYGVVVSGTTHTEQNLHFESNLYVESVTAVAESGDLSSVANWFDKNWWVCGTTCEQNVVSLIAHVEPSVEFESLDRESDGYLRPQSGVTAEIPGRYRPTSEESQGKAVDSSAAQPEPVETQDVN